MDKYTFFYIPFLSFLLGYPQSSLCSRPGIPVLPRSQLWGVDPGQAGLTQHFSITATGEELPRAVTLHILGSGRSAKSIKGIHQKENKLFSGTTEKWPQILISLGRSLLRMKKWNGQGSLKYPLVFCSNNP